MGRRIVRIFTSVMTLIEMTSPGGRNELLAAESERRPKLVRVKRIWDGTKAGRPHCAFPDLARFKGKWFCSLREGTVHGIKGHGRCRVIASADGAAWESVSLWEPNTPEGGDYRRPRISVSSDGRLAVVSKLNPYDKSAQRGVGEAFTAIAFSKDGRKWTRMQRISIRRAWFYSGVVWHKGRGYAIDRRADSRSTLYLTADGINYKPVTNEIGAGNESSISFLPDDRMVVMFRCGAVGMSGPPYTDWTINEKSRKGPHSYGGPNIIALPNGKIWAASRGNFEGKSATVLFKFDGEVLKPMLGIPGGGDRGYNGLVWRQGFLWMAFMSTPDEEARRKGSKSCIYFAKIRIPGVGAGK